MVRGLHGVVQRKMNFATDALRTSAHPTLASPFFQCTVRATELENAIRWSGL
jgi:hypothetical protein